MGKEKGNGFLKRFGPDVVYMTTGGFEHLVDKLGGQFLGFSARAAYGDALLVIRADFEGKSMVCFVSSATCAGAISRAHRELRQNKATWRPDKYAKEQ